MCWPGRFISKHVAQGSAATEPVPVAGQFLRIPTTEYVKMQKLFLVCRDSTSVDMSEFTFINKFSSKKTLSGENMPYARDGFHESYGVAALDWSNICMYFP
jgi:hypothetical protein